MLFNYLNDRIYHLLGTQLFFVVTQWLISVPLYLLLEVDSVLPLAVLTGAQATATTHLVVALQDQGLYHLFVEPFRTFHSHILRDALFLVSDIAPLIVLFYMTRIPTLSMGILLVSLVAIMWGSYAILRVIFPYAYN
jgi:hypothetical protein